MKNLYTLRYFWFEGPELRQSHTVVDADNSEAALVQLRDPRYPLVNVEIVSEIKKETLCVS